MANKILRGILENDSIQHRHEPSTPKHNRGRKKLRRSIKRKETNDALRHEEAAVGIKERYVRIAQSEWFKDAYENRPLGETMEIRDDI